MREAKLSKLWGITEAASAFPGRKKALRHTRLWYAAAKADGNGVSRYTTGKSWRKTLPRRGGRAKPSAGAFLPAQQEERSSRKQAQEGRNAFGRTGLRRRGGRICRRQSVILPCYDRASGGIRRMAGFLLLVIQLGIEEFQRSKDFLRGSGSLNERPYPLRQRQRLVVQVGRLAGKEIIHDCICICFLGCEGI